MSHAKTSHASLKPRKKKSALVAHRTSNQFKDFVKLLRESHERVSTRRDPDVQAVES